MRAAGDGQRCASFGGGEHGANASPNIWVGALDGERRATCLVLGSLEQALRLVAQPVLLADEWRDDRPGMPRELRAGRHELARVVIDAAGEKIVRCFGDSPFRQIAASRFELPGEIRHLDVRLRAKLAAQANCCIPEGARVAASEKRVDFPDARRNLPRPTAIPLRKSLEDVSRDEISHR